MSAAAAAAPAEEPPVVVRVSHGLRVEPVWLESPRPFQPNSGIVVGDDSVLVIDARATPRMAGDLVARVDGDAA